MGCCFKTNRNGREDPSRDNSDNGGQDQPLIDGKKSPNGSGKNKKGGKAAKAGPAEPNPFHKPSKNPCSLASEFSSWF